MSEERAYFLFYHDWYEMMKLASDEDKLNLLNAILKYAFDGIEPEDESIKLVFSLIKQRIDTDSVKYQQIKEKRRAAGLLSAQSKINKNQQNQQMPTNVGDVEICQQKPTYPTNNKKNNNKSNNNKYCSNEQLEHSKNKKEIVIPFEIDEQFREVFLLWLSYKKERRESYNSARGMKMCYTKLLNLSNNNPEIARLVVEQSMSNNWAGLFEYKNNGNKPTTAIELRADIAAAAYHSIGIQPPAFFGYSETDETRNQGE